MSPYGGNGNVPKWRRFELKLEFRLMLCVRGREEHSEVDECGAKRMQGGQFQGRVGPL